MEGIAGPGIAHLGVTGSIVSGSVPGGAFPGDGPFYSAVSRDERLSDISVFHRLL